MPHSCSDKKMEERRKKGTDVTRMHLHIYSKVCVGKICVNKGSQLYTPSPPQKFNTNCKKETKRKTQLPH